MPLADYAHWNEEAELVWWQEEGRHVEEPDYGDPQEDYDRYSAADAFAEELYEHDEEGLRAMLEDKDYLARWPKAERIIKNVMLDRGFTVPA